MSRRAVILSFVFAFTLFHLSWVTAEDSTAARQRFAKLLAELEKPKEPASIAITWSTQNAVGSTPNFYLVTSPNCGACPAAKRNATAAGIDYEEISVSKARSLGLFSATERSLVPQLICSDDEKNRIVGAHASSKMKAWANTFSVAQPDTTAVVTSVPSINVMADCLAAHLSETEELPTASRTFLRKTVITPAFVSEMLSQLMSGDTIQVADTGASIAWTGSNRTIQFDSTDRITINPPMTVAVKKLGIRLTTTLESIKINDAGNEIRLGLHGPDITFRFAHEKKL